MSPPLPARFAWSIALVGLVGSAWAQPGGPARQAWTPPAGAPKQPTGAYAPPTAFAAEPIYWGRHGLAIPYRWASASDAGQAAEVVLYLSTDRGVTWKKVTEAAPHVTSFLYQAPADGEYWFAVRTFDRYGSFRPAGELRPEMRVVVDTAPPVVLRAEGQLQGGVARVIVQATDGAAIDAASLRLYTQTDSYTGWTPTALAPTAPSDAQNATATAEWRPPAGARAIAARVTVADRAGNTSERSFPILNGAGPTGFAVGAPPRATPYQASPYEASPTTTKNPFDALGPAEPPTWRPTPLGPAVGRTVSMPVERSRVASSGWGSATAPPVANPTSAPPAATQAWPTDRGTTYSLPKRADRAPSRFESDRPRESPFSQASLSKPPPPPAAAGPFGAPLDSPVDRTVNSKKFEFDYDLDGVGQWGVANVELWGTDDGGDTWRRFAVDNDRKSPIHVAAPSEGVFGFRILVESVGGLPPAKPRPGDRPEAVVRVDLSQPVAVLTRVEQGQGYLGDQLTIDWRVDERHPADRPIDLYYSNRPEGPWAPIATNLADSGRYAWRLQRHVPERVFVRLEARDAAGNMGVATTPEAVAIRLPKPTGSLRGVRPVGR